MSEFIKYPSFQEMLTSSLYCELCGQSKGSSSNGPLCNCVRIKCTSCHELYDTTHILARKEIFHTCSKEETNSKQQLAKGSDPGLTGDPDFDVMLQDVMATLSSKGKEYTAGSSDRLANFKEVARVLTRPGRPFEKQDTWFTYFYKQYSSLVSYLQNDCRISSNEPIQSRIMDMIVYLILFTKIVREIEEERELGEQKKSV